MNKKTITRYYYTQIVKSLITIIGCIFLVQFDDTRRLSCIIGYLASIMIVIWIRDLIIAKKQ